MICSRVVVASVQFLMLGIPFYSCRAFVCDDIMAAPATAAMMVVDPSGVYVFVSGCGFFFFVDGYILVPLASCSHTMIGVKYT